MNELTIDHLPTQGHKIVIYGAGLGGATFVQEDDGTWAGGQYVTRTDLRNGHAVVQGHTADEYFLPLDGSIRWRPR